MDERIKELIDYIKMLQVILRYVLLILRSELDYLLQDL